jgi:hypothetical protein
LKANQQRIFLIYHGNLKRTVNVCDIEDYSFDKYHEESNCEITISYEKFTVEHAVLFEKYLVNQQAKQEYKSEDKRGKHMCIGPCIRIVTQDNSMLKSTTPEANNPYPTQSSLLSFSFVVKDNCNDLV